MYGVVGNFLNSWKYRIVLDSFLSHPEHCVCCMLLKSSKCLICSPRRLGVIGVPIGGYCHQFWKKPVAHICGVAPYCPWEQNGGRCTSQAWADGQGSWNTGEATTWKAVQVSWSVANRFFQNQKMQKKILSFPNYFAEDEAKGDITRGCQLQTRF